MGPWEDFLAFWIGPAGDDGDFDRGRLELWFGRKEEADRMLERRFGGLHARATHGELEDWLGNAHGRLAAIVLLDQLTRNFHRGDPAAFEQDPRARTLVAQALADGDEAHLKPVERVFLYLPLEHAEDLDLQRRAVERFTHLRDHVAEAHRPAYDEFLDYAVRHHDVIARFGRFPHRNAVLGRPSTPQELAFLRQPGSSF